MSLEYRLDGDATRTVVLAGSLGTNIEMWERQLRALTPRFAVLRYNHPGHGRSHLPEERNVAAFAHEVVRLLDALGLERVSFCGVSLGGAVGMQLALDAPERLEALVLGCTSARFATPEFWEERAAAVRAGGVEAIADVVVERWFTPAFPDVPRYRQMLASTPAEGYARCCEALRDYDLGGALRPVRAPTLAIAGADDPVTPPDQLQAIVDEIFGARLLVLDHARHLANVERADEFNDALLAQLKP
jgi:3-oxoadipate enol-lactonase